MLLKNVDTALTYLNIPYVWGVSKLITHTGIEQTVSKTHRKGYYGTDCSGLVNWTLLKNGNPLLFSDIDSVIVGTKNSHAIWEQAYNLGYAGVGWGAWEDGVVYFLDTNDSDSVDHCGFWYDDGSDDEQPIHALGGNTSKVILGNLDPRYHDFWFYDATIIYSEKTRSNENEFTKK